MTTPTVQLIADTTWNGHRITTFEVDIWKLLLAQLNTHGLLARSAASSRAIPAKKLRAFISANPFVPIFTKEQAGMVGGELGPMESDAARKVWLESLASQLDYAEQLSALGVHKEVANRLLEPYMRTKVVITATEWRNFIALRGGKGAQSEWSEITAGIREGLETSKPRKSQRHAPFVPVKDENELAWLEIGYVLKVSAARCSRTSFMLDQRPEKTISDELALADSLAAEGHWSPFDHPAIAAAGKHGRFVGWKSFRSTFGDTAHGDYQ